MGDTQQATDREIAEWLTMEHPVPRQVWTEWATHGVALLPLGKRFAAVRMTTDAVHAMVDSDQLADVASAVRDLLCGPVVYDRRAVGVTYYALVQRDTELVWTHDDVAPCLGQGVYLGVPRLDRREPPGTYWVVPPRYPGDLCTSQAVAALVEAGQRRLVESSGLCSPRQQSCDGPPVIT
ncbi:hypothetical protein [Streptomyces sp. NPDC001530]|uniref:hypothetical protein n=1 Tax=Streptomyces sp. NPDC001530 TaxID=3364582 RepID=UPI0036A3FE0D